MKKHTSLLIIALALAFCFSSDAFAAENPSGTSMETAAKPAQTAAPEVNSQVTGEEYRIGPEDMLDVSVLRPEQLQVPVTVAADGTISLPYIGIVRAKGKTLEELQKEIADKLSDGYMKYPVVAVSLKASFSRKFFVYGEVVKPGSYPMEENMTVFRALAVAGGFTKFGDSSKVKILRPKTSGPGYDMIKVDIKAVMNGKTDADELLKPGDVVVVSEGIF